MSTLFHHYSAGYHCPLPLPFSFSIQVVDYAKRKEMTVADVERWLGPILGYNADEEPTT